MARRRLTPLPVPPAPQPGTRAPDLQAGPHAGPEAPAGAPPIARVAGAEASAAALREVSQALAGARAEGRLALRLPLAQIEDGWLVRDRITPEGEEFEALVASLRSHGQRLPLEVAELGPDRYGLISGWRRLTALRRLHADTGEARFATALAVLRRPEGAAEAYLAMVEENEIRAGLSYYERARIAARAAEAGVFEDPRAALRALFGAASRPRRSKIGSFITLYRALDGHLRFAAAIPERLGLQLARVLQDDPARARALRGRLAAAAPQTPAEELALLAGALPGRGPDPQAAAPRRPGSGRGEVAPEGRDGDMERATGAPAVRLGGGPGRVTLSGAGVDAAFIDRLRAWLETPDAGSPADGSPDD